jgi:uncharacterized HhH-GPD family protein
MAAPGSGTLYVTGEASVDGLLNSDGTAVLIGMLLDQQIPMERAFAGPATLRDRLGHLDARRMAAMPVDEFVTICATKPAIHRFPSSMGTRVHELCRALTEHYDGDGAQVWAGVTSGDELYRRLRELPGFGDEKSRIFVALLGKRLGVQPVGWREAAGHFGDDIPRSVADIDSPQALLAVREWKQANKAAKAAKAATKR